jgi:NADPH:quinone reductase-like Zn-dependent oxidoreductase
MRAYQLADGVGIDRLTLADIEQPHPGRHQVLVKVHATSLNYRDLLIVSGQYGRGAITPGRIPLSDGAGEVVEVGEDVTRVKVGDRVAAIFHQSWIAGAVSDEIIGSALGGDVDGMLVEYRLLEEEGVVKLPDYLSYEEGATLPCAALTAWNALLEHQPVRPGDTVLVQGTGGVSIFALQLAHAAGARVIATSSSDEKLRRVKELGASDLVNYRKHPEWDEEVLRLTGGRGVDKVVEVGGAGTLPRSLRAVRRGGEVSVIGLLAGFGEIDPMVVLGKSIMMRGIYVGSREMFERMNRALEVHELHPVIDQVFGFEQAADAYRHLESGAHLGKVVIGVG